MCVYTPCLWVCNLTVSYVGAEFGWAKSRAACALTGLPFYIGHAVLFFLSSSLLRTQSALHLSSWEHSRITCVCNHLVIMRSQQNAFCERAQTNQNIKWSSIIFIIFPKNIAKLLTALETLCIYQYNSRIALKRFVQMRIPHATNKQNQSS